VREDFIIMEKEFNREEAMKRKAEIEFRLHAEFVQKVKE